MHRRFRAASTLIVTLALAGCISQRTVVPTDAQARAVTLQMMGETVTLHRVGESPVQVRQLRMEADSTSWFDAETNAFFQAPTWEIVSIERVDRSRGAKQGAGLAAAIAGTAVGGYVLYRMETADCSPNFFDFCGIGTSLSFAALAGVASALVAALPGGAIGAAGGERDIVLVAPVPPLSSPDQAPVDSLRQPPPR